jgi:CRP-like cAMP-binding protein
MVRQRYFASQEGAIRLVEKGEVLQFQGQQKPKVFHVHSGLLRSYFVDELGKEHTFMFAPEGWTIGDLEASTMGGPTTLIVEALELSEVEVISSVDWAAQEGLDLAVELKRIHRLAGTLQRRVLMLMSTGALGRYEYFLATYPDLSLRLSGKLIASYLGITPQALSRIRANRVGAERFKTKLT